MEIHVREVAAKGMATTFKTSLDTDWLKQVRKDVLSASPMDVNAKAWGEEGIAHVEGELTLDVELSCSRCLEPTKEHVVLPFHERFKLEATMDGSEPEDVTPVEEDKLELEPMLEEMLLLALPFVPLCDEDCKGLCHTCGTNLNERNCGCSNDRIDPRLAALKDLFNDSQS
ncbi:YceD family protein [Paenibacillus sp. GCM10023250]|uniref:YceD family protein n=1 Tax=Paenibacillus sp. GCM10023250 TaxID=3252648 RepID=UPI0036083DEA